MSKIIEKAISEIREIYNNRHRIWVLAKKELKLEFGQSKLGFLWSLLEPLSIILIYSTIFPLILGVSFRSWVLFFIAGYIPHRFLQEGIISTSNCLVDNKNILSQLSIKEEVLPLSTSLSVFIKFVLECMLFFSVIFFSGILPGPYILLFPVIAISELFIVLGFGMHLSVSFITFRDLQHILKVFFQALFFLVPIVYRLSKIPELYRNLYLSNPFSRLIILYQGSLLQNLENYVIPINFPGNILLIFFFSCGILLIGYMSFKRRKRKYIEEL